MNVCSWILVNGMKIGKNVNEWYEYQEEILINNWRKIWEI